MLFGNCTYTFRGLATHSEGLPSLLQQRELVFVCGQLKGEESVDIAAFDCSANLDNALRRVKYFIFEVRHLVILNCDLYSES